MKRNACTVIVDGRYTGEGLSILDVKGQEGWLIELNEEVNKWYGQPISFGESYEDNAYYLLTYEVLNGTLYHFPNSLVRDVFNATEKEHRVEFTKEEKKCW